MRSVRIVMTFVGIAFSMVGAGTPVSSALRIDTRAVIAKISHETLVEMVGTAHSLNCFYVNKFCKLGFVDYKGGACLASQPFVLVSS